jgi:hypothetical protein
MNGEEYGEEYEEEDDDKLLLCFGDDGKLHKYKPKPGIQFDFETENELKAFMKKLTEKGILTEGDKAFVKNVSDDFFEGFNNLTAAVSETLPEYDNDDLSD